MYEITVKWPDGRVFTQGGLSHKEASVLADFPWAAGADDVIVRCACGECETCYDRAIYEQGA